MFILNFVCTIGRNKEETLVCVRSKCSRLQLAASINCSLCLSKRYLSDLNLMQQRKSYSNVYQR